LEEPSEMDKKKADDIWSSFLKDVNQKASASSTTTTATVTKPVAETKVSTDAGNKYEMASSVS
jgi:hypothetical protein